MASVLQKQLKHLLHLLLIPLLLVFFSIPTPSTAHPLKICGFDQIYQLGDSISDTGNLIREVPIGASTAFAKLPYGETFFNNPTGRCSNGLLMIDYISLAAGLPLLPPYKTINTKQNFMHGVNFAVAGSTALSSESLWSQHVLSPVTNSSLGTQLEWMDSYFNSTCLDDIDCAEKLQSALFMVGEIGGNDYNYAIIQGKTMDELTSMVPRVVDAIIDAAKKVIDFGGTRLVVPGNFPIGCLPIYQTAFERGNVSSSASAYDDYSTMEIYDENQCLKQLNGFASYHNEKLKVALNKLREEKPNAVIVYGDYYKAYQYLLQFAKSRGFDTERACCGSGGKYNFDLMRMCGAPGVPVCPDPHRYMSWDGVHLTQKGYKIMAGWLLHDIFPKLNCHL